MVLFLRLLIFTVTGDEYYLIQYLNNTIINLLLNFFIMKKNLLKTALVMTCLALFSVHSISAQKKMCIVGDATHYGWDKGNASPMIQDKSNNSVFYYQAWLKAGSLKFILENTDDSWLPTWNKGDDTHIVKRNSSSDPDEQFVIATDGNYSVTVDTTNLTISIVPMTETSKITFNALFMVGDATPNGWDIANATELTKSTTDPFVFTYSGELNTGELKFPVNRNSGWGQEFFMKDTDTKMVLQSSPDSKWSIAEAGKYNITLNTSTLDISIVKDNNTSSMNATVGEGSITLASVIVYDQLEVNGISEFGFHIYALSGNLVLSGMSSTGTVNVASLGKGVYLLNINGKVFKFVKQ